MKPLSKAQFEELTSEEREALFNDLASSLGKPITVSEDDDLFAVYEEHFLKLQAETPSSPSRGVKKTKVTALDTVRFVDDDGKRRRLLKGETDSVGAKVAKQMKAEGLVS